jgi:hypothetical protein
MVAAAQSIVIVHHNKQPILLNLLTVIMVCTKCQKLSKGTTLATPGVKKKSEIYLGSPASSSSTTKSGDKTKTSATLGNNGIGKVSTVFQILIDDADSWIEQTTIKKRSKSLCLLLKLLHHL